MSTLLLTLNKPEIMSGDLWGRPLHFENRRCCEQRAVLLRIEMLVDCEWSLAHATGMIYNIYARTSARSLTSFPSMPRAGCGPLKVCLPRLRDAIFQAAAAASTSHRI